MMQHVQQVGQTMSLLACKTTHCADHPNSMRHRYLFAQRLADSIENKDVVVLAKKKSDSGQFMRKVSVG